ncbi:hypothetical protein DIPPA_35112 [Diplonema papillatum]|nr:hypothetical protein DIPPA_35112 [Diplonema papillatum]KAJ9463293.1 hypothetical protein DIPPA_35112 [Diplonema papillatum]
MAPSTERACLLAALMATAATAAVVENRHQLPCGPCGDCCDTAVDTYFKAAGGAHRCESRVTGAVCNLCATDNACPNPVRMVGTQAFGVAKGSLFIGTGPQRQIENGMRGWDDLPDAAIFRFPDYVLGQFTQLPTYTFDDWSLRYTCGSQLSAFAGCDVNVFVYRCPPCPRATPDDFAATLAALGFEAQACGPAFQLKPGEDSVVHNLVMYHQEVEVTARETISTGVPAEFIFASIGAKDVLCRDVDDPVDCEALTGCYWDDIECRSSPCPRKLPWVGPTLPSCQVCTADETQYLP